ncbi:type I methionyl aminopeptidase [Peptococcaceae bacterium]|nr:type I methionyl aminopeptidase [Peptococcaceae bacterium]
MINYKSERELNYMRDAGKIVALTHKELEKAIKPGISTKELNDIAEDFIKKQGARPAFKGLYSFPAAVCISVNEEVVHGIPSQRKLEVGDIVGCDLGVEIEGYFGDAAYTYRVEPISDRAMKLLEVAERALYLGIEKAVSGNRLTDISHAIQSFVESNGFSVVRKYVGHGIGSKLHEDPQVPNFGRPGRGIKLKPGLTLAIEPMVNEGAHEVVTLSNNWTVVTKDRKLSAHFEHTVAITDGAPEILTKL